MLSLLSLFAYKLVTTDSRQFRKTVLLGCIYKWQQNTLYIGSLRQCLFNYSISIICYNFLKIFPVMLVLRLMLSVTYYVQNHAGIIGWSLATHDHYIYLIVPYIAS